MDSKLQSFAKVLLKEQYDEFMKMVQLFNVDKRTFVSKHMKKDGMTLTLRIMP